MPSISERLNLRSFFWRMGAAILFGFALIFAILAACAYAVVSGVAWMLGIDPLPWYFVIAVVWVPAVIEHVLTALSRWIVGDPTENRKQLAGGVPAFNMVIGGVLAANCAVIVLLIELFEWVTSSEWPGLTLADGLAIFGIIRDLPETETQRLIDLLLAIPLSISLFVVGVLLCVAGLNRGDRSVGR